MVLKRLLICLLQIKFLMLNKMKTFTQFITEQSSRIDIKEEGDWSNRIFFTALLKDSEKNWLQKNIENFEVAESTLDINNKENSVYLNRVDTKYSGKGYARELVNEIISRCKQRQIKSISTYIENSNVESKNMINKLGFEEVEIKKDGSVYELNLK